MHSRPGWSKAPADRARNHPMNDTIDLLKRRRSAPPAAHDRAGPDGRRNSRRSSPSPRACPTTASSRRGASSCSRAAARERAGRIALMIRLEDKPDLDEKATGGGARALRARAAGRRGRVARGAPRQDPGMGAGAVGRRGLHEPDRRGPRARLRRDLAHRVDRPTTRASARRSGSPSTSASPASSISAARRRSRTGRGPPLAEIVTTFPG